MRGRGPAQLPGGTVRGPDLPGTGHGPGSQSWTHSVAALPRGSLTYRDPTPTFAAWHMPGLGTFPDGSSVHSVSCWVGGLGDRSPQPSFPSRAKVGGWVLLPGALGRLAVRGGAQGLPLSPRQSRAWLGFRKLCHLGQTPWEHVPVLRRM